MPIIIRIYDFSSYWYCVARLIGWLAGWSDSGLVGHSVGRPFTRSLARLQISYSHAWNLRMSQQNMNQHGLLILDSSPSLSLSLFTIVCRFVLVCMHACLSLLTLMSIHPFIPPPFFIVSFVVVCCCCPSVFVYFCMSHTPISMSCYHVDAVDRIKVFFL